jgi:glycosyltransferase involved in cell wall biosynthesis
MSASLQSSQVTVPQTTNQRLLLFDLDVRGHHPGYIQHLVRYWCEQCLPGQLDILVTPQFLQKHREVVETATQPNVQFVAITPVEAAVLVNGEQLGDSFKGRIQRAFQEWKILRQYLIKLQTTHCLIMYLDTILLRLAFGAKFPCQFSSIYFRPIFHYQQFSNFTPTRRERIWQLRDRVCLSRFLKHPQLHTLFCLDSFAVKRMNQFQRQPKSIHITDPVYVHNHTGQELEQLRQSLDVQPNRRVLLMFGVLSRRKGIFELLEAIAELPAEICQTICLLLIGPLEMADKTALEVQIQRLTQIRPIQIICRHNFIADQGIQPYFQIANLVLAPYQRHIGMSAILVRAAAAGTPVLSSDFGLMGEVTRYYKLGLTVDSTVPTEIAKGIELFLSSEQENICDRAKMQQFVEQNRADRFSQMIFERLWARQTDL